MAEVSVIIVTHNSIGTIKTCLDSVKNQSFKDLDIFVIDNNSQDGTAGFLKSSYPGIKLIENKKNLGFGRASNQGICLARSNYVLTLNPDAFLEIDFISSALEFLNKEGDRRIGMASGKMLREDGVTIDSTGLVLTAFRRFFDRGSGEKDNGRYGKREKIFGPCAAAAFYKKDMLEALKVNNEYFDEDFFCFVEDVDLAWRANKKGWICYYLPEARCFHARSSRSYKKSLMQYYAFRNRFLMNMKNDRVNICTIPGILFYDVPRFLFMLLTNPLSFRAAKDIIFYAHRMLTKRRELYE